MNGKKKRGGDMLRPNIKKVYVECEHCGELIDVSSCHFSANVVGEYWEIWVFCDGCSRRMKTCELSLEDL